MKKISFFILMSILSMTACGVDLDIKDEAPSIESSDSDNSSDPRQSDDPTTNDNDVIILQGLTLKVNILNFDKIQGKICVAIFEKANEGEFGNTDLTQDYSTINECKNVADYIIDGQVNFEFSLIPGRYAVTTFHDVNDNDIFDQIIILGSIPAPNEPFGFSRNPTLGFGSPSFEQCAFDITEGNIHTENIPLRKFFG